MSAREKRGREGEPKEEAKRERRVRQGGKKLESGKGVRVLKFAREGRKGRASSRSVGLLSLVTGSGENRFTGDLNARSNNRKKKERTQEEWNK